jgi:hypothetical protein
MAVVILDVLVPMVTLASVSAAVLSYFSENYFAIVRNAVFAFVLQYVGHYIMNYGRDFRTKLETRLMGLIESTEQAVRPGELARNLRVSEKFVRETFLELKGRGKLGDHLYNSETDLIYRRERPMPTLGTPLTCATCGASNDSDSLYCKKCGRELGVRPYSAP